MAKTGRRKKLKPPEEVRESAARRKAALEKMEAAETAAREAESAEETGSRPKKPASRRRKKRMTRRGVLSCFIAVPSLVFFVLLMWTAYRLRSDVTQMTGLFGFLAALLSLLGVFLGVRGFREQGKRYAASWIGTTVNTVFVILYGMIFYLGLR